MSTFARNETPVIFQGFHIRNPMHFWGFTSETKPHFSQGFHIRNETPYYYVVILSFVSLSFSRRMERQGLRSPAGHSICEVKSPNPFLEKREVAK